MIDLIRHNLFIFQIKLVRWLDDHNYPKLTEKGITEIVMAVNNSDGTIPMFSHSERAR